LAGGKDQPPSVSFATDFAVLRHFEFEMANSHSSCRGFAQECVREGVAAEFERILRIELDWPTAGEMSLRPRQDPTIFGEPFDEYGGSWFGGQSFVSSQSHDLPVEQGGA
jgi:hypothetical protein